MPFPVKKTMKNCFILSKVIFFAIIFLHANVQWVNIMHNIKKVPTKTVVGVDLHCIQKPYRTIKANNSKRLDLSP